MGGGEDDARTDNCPRTNLLAALQAHDLRKAQSQCLRGFAVGANNGGGWEHPAKGNCNKKFRHTITLREDVHVSKPVAPHVSRRFTFQYYFGFFLLEDFFAVFLAVGSTARASLSKSSFKLDSWLFFS